MAQRPHRDERLIEAIEACRPGSDDVSDPALDLAGPLAADPELDELYERCQRLDAQVAAVFGDVPVPEGLADRIVARLLAAERAPVAAVEVEAPAADRAEPQASPRAPRRVGRRWLAAAAVAAGLAVSAAIFLVQFDRKPPLTARQIQSGALDFAMQDADRFGTGELLTESNEPAELPYSRALYQFRGTRVRPVDGLLGRSGVAYDVTGQFGHTATLYVFRAHPAGTSPLPDDLPSEPPRFRDTDRTGGYCSATWRSGDVLYVLVVRHDSKRTYDGFVQPPGTVT